MPKKCLSPLSIAEEKGCPLDEEREGLQMGFTRPVRGLDPPIDVAAEIPPIGTDVSVISPEDTDLDPLGRLPGHLLLSEGANAFEEGSLPANGISPVSQVREDGTQQERDRRFGVSCGQEVIRAPFVIVVTCL